MVSLAAEVVVVDAFEVVIDSDWIVDDWIEFDVVDMEDMSCSCCCEREIALDIIWTDCVWADWIEEDDNDSVADEDVIIFSEAACEEDDMEVLKEDSESATLTT